MSDLQRPPKPHVANTVAIADFAEIECLRRADRNVSSLDIVRVMQRGADGGEADFIEACVEAAFSELANRAIHCGSERQYPFDLLNEGALLQLRAPSSTDSNSARLYFYLLLATRMNMKSDRNHGGEDATILFEHLCREVAVRFWGGPSDAVRGIVFGTGRIAENLEDDADLDCGAFQTEVNRLCRELGEGDGFASRGRSRVTARDGKLDIVVWKRFADRRIGQLIGFGQCKTGTHWEGDLLKLRPEGFCDKWMRSNPAVLPVRLYFVADRVLDRWYERCKDGGILFDRCRIMEYADTLPDDVTQRLRTWVAAASSAQGLSLP